MAASRLLTATETTGFSFVPTGSAPGIEQFPALRALLDERVPAVASLFAEPQPDRRPGQAGTRVSWYAPASQAPVPLVNLPFAERTAAEESLRAQVAALGPLLTDPATAPLLRAALTVPAATDLLWTGEAVALVNWGMMPAGTDGTPAALAAHWAKVFQDILPLELNPWKVPATAPAAPPSLSPSPPGSAAPPPVAPGGHRGLSLAATIAAAVAIVLLVAGIALAAGYYAGWTILARRLEATAPRPPEPGLDAGLRRMQEAVNDGLRRRVDQLETALRGDVCTLDAGGAGRAPLSPMPPVLAAPPEQQPVQRPAAPGQPAQATNLADLLEQSTVLVLAEIRAPNGDTGLATGSGFAVAPDRVVTNLHVVDNALPGRLLVASRKLGRAVPAEVVARTRNHEIGQPDFAVLRLQTGTLPPLALSTGVDRLLPVVAVGFPGFVTGAGDDFRRFLDGDNASIPAAHFTSGEVSAVQAFEGQQVIVHTANLNRGNSGGPLTDRCGRVVGVNTFIRTDQETAYRVDYALTATVLATFLGQNGVDIRREDGPCHPETPPPPTPATPSPVAPAPATPAPTPPATPPAR
ncbi:Trypsin-like peptidase domain-containing protein [Rhodovastum atsumiense]|uniref:Trypsin-like peptidase domain-containing protein n=1 Tax=Rhodovastum atsumiense TaxID=504468 RepID=A0A5M6IXQ4_9PROT|nr:serine protease [Rhodovastum atsumiense]KAA5612178.1 trypsin-like peptidase domain-containing protein [Rhodovastum atsumiense]CAH2603868.1 Trypsin-like peptidase domain-containing protein [Rhodovastum atsumiense]